MMGRVRSVFDGTEGSALFVARVRRMMAEGWGDPDFTARQFVDDVYRETGVSYHENQGVIEEMIREVMDADRTGREEER